MTPCLATPYGADASLRRADQLAGLKQGRHGDESVRPWPVSRRQGKRSGELQLWGIFSLAIHRLREVAADVDRLGSKEGVNTDKKALEIIWNAYI